jgi:hypothetical protein
MCTDDTRPGSDGPSRDGGSPGIGGGRPGCSGGLPGSAAGALAMMDAALDFLNGDFLNGPGGAGRRAAGSDCEKRDGSEHGPCAAGQGRRS